jgi:molybdopterin/thiamine biosynthesis adenylyltransferase
MSLYDRQERIVGWEQERLQHATVVVVGQGWLGTFLVWALGSLGVGNILWVGRPRRSPGACPHRLGAWFLGTPSPFPQTRIHLYPCAIEYETSLNWVLGEQVHTLACCTEHPDERILCQRIARDRGLPWLVGSGAGGGWFGQQRLPSPRRRTDNPVASLAVAALLADAIRETLLPLAGGMLPLDGPLHLKPGPPLADCGLRITDSQTKSRAMSPSSSAHPQSAIRNPQSARAAILIGAGGIGVYVAAALTSLGYPLHVVDFDRVEESNLNRQGLFTPEDARRRAHKSRAAHRALRRLFAGTRVSSEVQRVDASFAESLRQHTPPPGALLSAVDNARTRLILQQLGQDLNLPVIQGGTDTFAADCFTQTPASQSLDTQMHGALSAAAEREKDEATRRRRQGGCAGDPSYVVPGMLAGALMAYRFTHLEDPGASPPWRWRTGSLPVQQRSLQDGFNFTELTDQAC